MRGVGGEVGPALDRDGSLSSLFTEAQLSDYVCHDEGNFPRSNRRFRTKTRFPCSTGQKSDHQVPLASD